MAETEVTSSTPDSGASALSKDARADVAGGAGPGAEAREIVILGAKEHNLRNIDVRIPRDKLVVITGLSGSGKSSLAFDTIYAEGQRKYVESLSAYARQFLEQLSKPDVEHIEGLPPTVAIEQRAGGQQPAFDRRDHHGNLRLPAAAVRPRRRAALLALRPAHHQPDRQPDGRRPVRAARGHAVHGARADRPRPEGPAQRAAAARPPRGLRPRADRRADPRPQEPCPS